MLTPKLALVLQLIFHLKMIGNIPSVCLKVARQGEDFHQV